jgi:hypothetical protein
MVAGSLVRCEISNSLLLGHLQILFRLAKIVSPYEDTILTSKTASLYVGQRAGVLLGTNRPYDSLHCAFVQANLLESKVYNGSYQSCLHKCNT